MYSPSPDSLPDFEESRYNFISKEIHDSVIAVSDSDNTYLLTPLVGQDDTEKKDHTSSLKTWAILNENDKKIFDELKAYIFQGDWESLLVKLIENPDFPVNSQDTTDRNFTLLHHACLKKKVECVKVLVKEFMVNPDIKADNGWTSIHTLLISDCRCKSCCNEIILCLQILLENEDDETRVNAEDDLGETPLYYAARNKLAHAASFLLSNGANINHWVNGTSVATLLAEYLPGVLKNEFDKRITIYDSERQEGVHRGLRLDFRLLLQEPAIHEGFTSEKPSRKRGKRILPAHLRHERRNNDAASQVPPLPNKKQKGSNGIRTGTGVTKRQQRGQNDKLSSPIPTASSSLSSTLESIPSASTSCSVPPTETELLNYLLKADLSAIEYVVNHPLVEAFVHLKWLSVRRLFFIQRSLYLFLISLYTFYVFDTFVNATCFYNKANASATVSTVKLANTSNSSNVITAIFPRSPQARSTNANNGGNDEIVAKGSFGLFIPTASTTTNGSKENRNPYRFHSFVEYFKAHEMNCEWRMSTTIMGYLFAAFAVGVVLYELYKMCEDKYDYFKDPLNWCWWILAFSIGVTLVPGLGLFSHSWLYPFAAFTLIYGWILLLVQIGRIPYFGIFIGIFVKVVKDFCLLLLTFSPLLLGFSLGFSIMLPQNEFFRFIPVAVFKVFLMMTGDVDFWGVFKGTWTDAEHQGHVYIPLFVMYSVFILMVTMVLMSLLLGIAIDNLQEMRHEAALRRTVGLIREIEIFESLLQKPAIHYFCCCSQFFRRMLSITSLKYMNGPELITYPEDPEDKTLPNNIKQKLIQYLTDSSSCCDPSMKSSRRKEEMKKRLQNKIKSERDPDIKLKRENRMSVQFISGKESSAFSMEKMKEKRRTFFGEPQQQPQMTEPGDENESFGPSIDDASTRNRDLVLYEEVKLLLEDNEKMREKLEALKRTLLLRR